MRYLIYGVIAVPLLLSFTSLADVVTLKPIFVSGYAQFKEATIYDFPYAIKVYTREDIEKSGALNLLDFLKREATLNVSDWFGTGVKANVDLMGFGDNANSNILLLINGRRVNDIDLSGIDWSQVPLDIVERIEILKGPGCVLYGDNAVGGVINVITRKADEPAVSVSSECEFGSYSLDRESMDFNFSGENYGLYINAEHLSTDGYRKNSHYRSKSFYLNTFRALSPGRILFEVGYHDYWYGLPGSLYDYEIGSVYSRRDSKYPLDNASMGDLFLNIGFEKPLSSNSKIGVNFYFRDKDGKDNWLSYGTWSFIINRNIQHVGARIQFFNEFELFSKLNTLIVGTEFHKADFSADTIYLQYQFLDDWTDIDRKTIGLFIQDSINILDTLSLFFGTRFQREDFSFDYTSRLGTTIDQALHFGEEAYEVGINKRFKKGNIFINFSRGFRVPKTDEYFSVWATPPVNKELLPQKNKTISLGANFELGENTRFNMDLFQMKVKDELYYDPLTFENKNYPEIERRGASFALDIKPLKNLSMGISYRFTEAEFSKGSYKGKKVPAVPQNLFGIKLIYSSFGDKLLIYFDTKYRDSVYLINDLENKVEKLDSFWISNMKMEWKIKEGIKAYFGVNNIFNAKYCEYGATNSSGTVRALYPSPERNYYIGLKVEF